MAKTRLYLVRHGKTMFNTIGRAQGWSDTPLTEVGERGIHELGIGLREAGLDFKLARSSDSGRTIQTMGIILEELGLTGQIPYTFDKRIREWCFGSFDGGYDGELFMGVMPRVFNIEHVHQLSYAELAEGLVEVDTAGWAENWEKLSGRIWEGCWWRQCSCSQPRHDHRNLCLSNQSNSASWFGQWQCDGCRL